mgnify:CR=1 FL=1
MITTLVTTNVSKYIHPLTKEVAIEVASNLLPEDRNELEEGHGLDPQEALVQSVSSGASFAFLMPDGNWAAAGGVDPFNGIWLLCTPHIHSHPITFTRQCKRFIEHRPEKYLWNIADKRNTVHLKLLRFLGFKFLREIEYGPNKLSFIEFCRVQPYSVHGR